MNSDIKAKTRSKFLQLLHSVPIEIIENASAEICMRIINMEKLIAKTAGIVVYAAIQFEIRLDRFVNHALMKGTPVYYPRYNNSSHQYNIVKITHLKTDLSPGYLAIPEPNVGLHSVGEYTDISQFVWFIPGIAFDIFGGRIGRGKGFYDSLLNRYGGKKIGIGYDWQLTPRIPTNKHDIGLNSLISDKRYLEFEA